MKNIRNILRTASVAACVVGAVGCSDLLDLEPPMTRVTDNFYRTEGDAFEALTSAYNVLTWSAPSTAGGSPQNCAFEMVSEMLSDCCYGGGANANDIPKTVALSQYQVKVDDPAPEALWSKYYTGIYRCNQFFAKIDGAAFDDENLRNRYKAEVHFLRAYYYFDLVRLFGNVPLILEPLAPADYAQVQAAPAVIYEQIAKDLLAAIGAVDENEEHLLPKNAMALPSAEKGRVSLAAAQSLLARVWLYYTGYYGQSQLPLVAQTLMLSIIRDVVNGSGHGLVADGYSTRITGSSKLFDVTSKGSVEGVFEIQYSNLSKWGDWSNRQGCMGNQSVILWGIRDVSAPYAAGWSFAPVNKDLFNSFSSSDPRRWASIINANRSAASGDDGEALTYTAGYQNTGYFNRKYTPYTRNNAGAGSRELNYPNNYQAIRYADVLLMASELELRYGDVNAAYAYYKMVRERALGAGKAGTAGGAGSVTDLTLNQIFRERLYELALEGHRYWDVLRQGQVVAAQTFTITGSSREFNKVYNVQCAGLLPIPQYEIRQSKSSLKQNPGYN